MRRLPHFIGVLVLSFLVVATGHTNPVISLEKVDGLLDPSTIWAGGNVRFILRLTNDQPVGYAISNGFRVYSPDGAVWDSTASDTLGWRPGDASPGVAILGKSYFDLPYVLSKFSADGHGADTIGYLASKIALSGIPAGFSDTAWSVTAFNVSRSSDGLHLCIDSAWFPLANTWKWVAQGGTIALPSWSGPYCFTIRDEPDSDYDGIADMNDNCPFAFNQNQEEGDGDGIGDACDNCVSVANADQADMDNDGKGNACDPGQVNFSASPRCGGVGSMVTFTDLTIPQRTLTSWTWDFGDGQTGSGQNPTHQYNSVGTFTVKLTVGDGIGTDMIIRTGYITTEDRLTIDFDALPRKGRPQLFAAFDTQIQGIASQFQWDFGDGQTASDRNPIHLYDTPGKYTVSLIATSNIDGCNQADTVVKSDYILVTDLAAGFGSDKTAGTSPLAVNFQSTSSGAPTSYLWDFGDGGTSTLPNPSHVFTGIGKYDIKLTVTNALTSDNLTRLGYIEVRPPEVDLTVDAWISTWRPGFSYLAKGYWTNTGNVPVHDCVLKVRLPQVFQTYSGTLSYVQDGAGTYSGYTMIADTLIVPLGTVAPTSAPGGCFVISGFIGQWPAVIPGRVDSLEAWVSTSSTETQPANNYIKIVQVVVGSIDPNDKKAIPVGVGAEKIITPDNRLHYTIQFENKKEATTEALFVRVIDTLDPDLDWSTLVMDDMSHPTKCTWSFDPITGVIEWFCDSIMLLPNVVPPQGEGYFTYSVTPKSNLAPNTEISNSAWIRFDFNEWLYAPENGQPLIHTVYSGCCAGSVGNADGDLTDMVDIGDVQALIDFLFFGSQVSSCAEENDANRGGDGVDLSDLQALVDYLFFSAPLLPCP